MNLTQEPFTDKKVREAFAYAIDRETLCAEIRSGNCVPTLSWIPPGSPAPSKPTSTRFDPDAAKQALAESSYGGRTNCRRSSSTSTATIAERGPKQSEWIAGQIRDILGIELDARADGRHDPDRPAQGRRRPTRSCSISAAGIQDYPDPQNWLSVVLDL